MFGPCEPDSRLFGDLGGWQKKMLAILVSSLLTAKPSKIYFFLLVGRAERLYPKGKKEQSNPTPLNPPLSGGRL
jgi:hypothetical protein